jgi:hypothetical protein
MHNTYVYIKYIQSKNIHPHISDPSKRLGHFIPLASLARYIECFATGPPPASQSVRVCQSIRYSAPALPPALETRSRWQSGLETKKSCH